VSVPTLVVGAAQSGVGKTTVTLALIAALRRRGLRVQPFKVGPDYLDPSLLTWAAGRACRNLDGWMLPVPHLLELFERACRGADVAVVEGVMGLFDGRTGGGQEPACQADGGDQASTAAVARLLGAPLVLVLDARRASRTVGAVALGLSRADPALEVLGAVLNGVASDRHREACADGLAALGIRCLGHLHRRGELALPDRYLGLVAAAEAKPPARLRRSLQLAGEGLDLDALLRGARPAPPARPPARPEPSLFPASAVPTEARVAVASDRAFHFYYRDSLDLLEAWGAELVPFSPLESPDLPAGAGGVYLGGGYPELFARELAANAGLLASLRRAHRRGVLLYAECGGAMVLARAIEDADGRRHRMAGLWPVSVSLRRRRLSVGYRRVRACAASFLAGQELPAHEFHYSQLRRGGPYAQPAWLVLDDGRQEGYAAGRLAASYIHLHLGSRPGLARSFVAACRRSR
jgi:cobyrinic acid a,c-diamide synthase